MKLLAFEASTQLAGVAVIIDGRVVAEESSQKQRTHSEVISVFADNVLKRAGLGLSDIDIFATGEGPGSFTGIRVAASAAKTFAYSFQKPMVCVDTLTTLASMAPSSPTALPILTLINAYKNMVYVALFQARTAADGPPVPLLKPTAVSVRDLSDIVGPLIPHQAWVVGDGYLDYAEYFPPDLQGQLVRPNRPSDFPSAGALGLLAEKKALQHKTLDWNLFLPLYIRASEAEESLRGILVKPLK